MANNGKVGGYEEINSVAVTLLRIKQDLGSCLINLGKLDRLQEAMLKVGVGNPYAIVKATVKDAAIDGGYVRALENARSAKDPVSRSDAYLRMVEDIVESLEGVERKQVKLEARLGTAGTTDAENETISSLTVKGRETIKAMGLKRDEALKRCLCAKKAILTAAVRIDERLRKLWPSGAPELRVAVLNANCAEEIQALALDEEIMKTGKTGGKRVKI